MADDRPGIAIALPSADYWRMHWSACVIDSGYWMRAANSGNMSSAPTRIAQPAPGDPGPGGAGASGEVP
ncbi:MAG: hypothetical protein V8S34_02295 [Lawsonibacter sp.]